jgi:DNA-directed RNA polymerase specialized sigma24 family protein
MRELAVTFKSIWYFTTRATRRQIEAMLDTFTPQMRKPFVLYDLKEYGNEYGIS